MKKYLVPLIVALSPFCSKAQSLGEAVDNTNLVWSSGGDAAWSGQSAVTHDGADAAASGTILDSQESWLQTTVTGPGVVTFWWKVSSEQDFDELQFSIGGVLQVRVSGEVDWQQAFMRVAAGSQTLRWRYAKDLFSSSGQDKAWLDQVMFVPDTGSPTVLGQPVSRTVAQGAPVTFQVVAAGEPTLRYQWFFNQTNAIAGATNASMIITNTHQADAGAYRVMVSNLLDGATSSNALLTIVPFGSVTNILLFAEFTGGPYQTALGTSGRAFQMFNDDAVFGAAVASANLGRTLVVVDSYWLDHAFSSVTDYVRAGGRAILQYYDMPVGSPLAAAFNANVVGNLTSAMPAYFWSNSPLFAGLSSPLLFSDLYIYDGLWLNPAAGGQAVAGFALGPTAGEAALIIGNSGRTIVTGFVLEEASSTADGIRFAQNEIDYLAPIPPSVVVFADNFDADTSTGWTINRSSGDTLVTFNYDYSADGIPSAPHSTNGTTRGVKFKANLASGAVAAVNMSPVGQSFTGDYRLHFDMWINVNIGGVGSTEHFSAGIGTTGNRAQWNGTGSTADGFWFTVDGEGGVSDTSATAGDFEAYSGTVLQSAASGVYAAGTASNARGAGNPYYAGSFPSGQTAPLSQGQGGSLGLGNVGLAWRYVIISKAGSNVTWSINGLTIATFTGITLTGSNIFIGYWDKFASVSGSPALSFGLVDNLRVEVPVLPAISLNIQSSDNAVVLSWSNPSFSLQAAPAADGVFTNVPGAVSPYTNPITAPQQFFRLQAN